MSAEPHAGTYAHEALVPQPHPVPESAPQAARELVETHREALEQALAAVTSRAYLSRYPESPSPRVYGDDAADAGERAFEAHLTREFSELDDQPATDGQVGDEHSPYGPDLRISYPHQDAERLMTAAQAAIPAWRDA